MRLYDVTDCAWAKEKGQTTTLEQRGLELTVIDMLNYCSEELGDDETEYKFANYELVNEYLTYTNGEVHVLDGGDDVFGVFAPEYGDLYFSHAYKCASGQAVMVFYRTLEDAFECENEVLMTF